MSAPQFLQWYGRHFGSNVTEHETQLALCAIILGGAYAFPNLRASRSVVNGKLTQRLLSSPGLWSGRGRVAIHLEVAMLKWTEKACNSLLWMISAGMRLTSKHETRRPRGIASSDRDPVDAALATTNAAALPVAIVMYIMSKPTLVSRKPVSVGVSWIEERMRRAIATASDKFVR